ncbi:hypothetical protein EV363DRAFT_883706 [Boletus edulis]|nr:hypothetical protein EV363DRAFT_883706 [Boletus edulis]
MGNAGITFITFLMVLSAQRVFGRSAKHNPSPRKEYDYPSPAFRGHSNQPRGIANQTKPVWMVGANLTKGGTCFRITHLTRIGRQCLSVVRGAIQRRCGEDSILLPLRRVFFPLPIRPYPFHHAAVNVPVVNRRHRFWGSSPPPGLNADVTGGERQATEMYLWPNE